MDRLMLHSRVVPINFSCVDFQWHDRWVLCTIIQYKLLPLLSRSIHRICACEVANHTQILQLDYGNSTSSKSLKQNKSDTSTTQWSRSRTVSKIQLGIAFCFPHPMNITSHGVCSFCIGLAQKMFPLIQKAS